MIDRVGEALKDFLKQESAGGIVLIVAAALALLIANTPLAAGYFGALETKLNLSYGAFAINKPLLMWINDGLMAIFFFLIGLEVKREILEGQLSSWDKASLPLIAAIGGMAIPALIFLGFNWNSPATINGWAIPAATDIAFALGILSLLGPRVPVALKALLLAVAVIDDIGAITIIALFYSGELKLDMLLAAGFTLLVLALIGRARFGSRIPYVLLTVLMWVFVLKSGVHATLAGVATAMFVPLIAGDERPLERLEHALHPWVAFLILPIFAFANAGVSFAGAGMAALFAPLSLGIAAGLVIGKQVGIFGACWIAARTGLATVPREVSFRQLYGLACLAGIGFTMSLFIGGLAFDAAVDIDAVKMGVLTGSFISAIIGLAVLLRAPNAIETSTPEKAVA